MPVTQRQLEFWAVILISIAAVLSAWCAYESARWSNLQSRSYARANAERVESLRQSDLANRQTMVDVNLFIAYESALASNNRDLAAFLARRFPDRLKPAFEAWLKTDPLHHANAPSSPFTMPQYQSTASNQADALEQQARSTFEAGAMANETADKYVLMTVLFAAVSFLAGVGSKFDVRSVEIIALTLGSVVLLVAGTVLFTTFPVR